MYTRQGFLFSTGLHLSLLAIAYVGMPEWFESDIEPQPLVISLEALPITDKTNVKPSVAPVTKPKEKPTPPPPPEKPTPPASKPKAAPPKPKVAEPVPAPNKAEPDKAIPKEKKPKPEPEKPKPKKAPKPKEKEKADSPQTDDLEEILKNLEKQAQNHNDDPKKKSKKDAPPPQNPTQSAAPYDPTQPLSLSERDAITSQFIQCWSLPAGAANDHTLRVSMDVWLNQDGSVIRYALASEQAGRYRADRVFKAAADSAGRAIRKCSPIRNLPTDKYNSWKEMRLNFDPSMQLR